MPQSPDGLVAVLLAALVACCYGSPTLLMPKGTLIAEGLGGVAFSFEHEVIIFGETHKNNVQHFVSRKNGRVAFGRNAETNKFEPASIRQFSMLHPSEMFDPDTPDIAFAYEARLTGGDLREIEAIVRENFWNNAEFSALGGHIFTWEKQRSHGNPTEQENTFQAAVIYDTTSTYVLYNYLKVTYFNVDQPLAGFSRGGSFDTARLPFTAATANKLPQQSGLGNRTLGRYVYRIDTWPPLRGGCLTEDGDRALSSTVVRDSVLGGSVAIVSSRCHDRGVSGTCTVSVGGAILGESPTIACNGSSNCAGAGMFLACRIPPAYRQGQATLSLAINTIAGSFSTGINFVNPDEAVTGKIDLAGDFENWMKLSSQGLQITYDSTLRGALKLRVIGYSEAGLSQIDVANTPMKTLLEVDAQSNGQMDVSSLSCPPETAQCDTHHVGFLEIVDSGYPPRYLRSRILPLGWFVHKYYTDRQQHNWYRHKCSALTSTDESTQRIRERLQALTCPASLVQAKADSSRYLRLGYCPDLPLGCTLATPSQTCFVSRVESGADFPSAPASLCCYTAAGHLLYQDFISGNDGSQHGSRAIRAHPDGVTPAGNNPLLAGRVAFMSHWYWDALQFLYCCRWSNVGDCPFYFMHERPTPKLSSFVAGRGGGIVGDPHLTSFSGRPYLFNGLGEYWLQRTDSNFQVQGRFMRINSEDKATFLVAVAVRVGTGATFQASVSASASAAPAGAARFQLYRREPDTDVQTEIALATDRLFIEGGVTVRLASPDNLVLQLSSNDQSMGIDLYAADGFSYMNAYVALSASLKGLTRGLLGRWTDNAADEFVDVNGNTIAFQPNASEFHRTFCKNNLLAALQDSLFVYDGRRASIFQKHNVDWVSQYEPTARFSVDDISAHGQEAETCKSNAACIFDLRVMQSTTIGGQTAQKSAEFVSMQASANEAGRYCEKPAIRGLSLAADAVLMEGASLRLSCAPQLHAARGEETIQCVRQADGLRWQPDPTGLSFSCQIDGVNPETFDQANVGLIVGITVPVAVLLIIGAIVLIIVLRRRSAGNAGGGKGGSRSSQQAQGVGASRTTIVSEGSAGGGVDNQGQANRRVPPSQSSAAAGDGSSSMGRQYETRQQQQKQQQQQPSMGQSDDPRASYNQAQMVPMEPAGEFNPEYASIERQRGPARSEVV